MSCIKHSLSSLIRLVIVIAVTLFLSGCADMIEIATIANPIVQVSGYTSNVGGYMSSSVEDNTSYITEGDDTLWATYNKAFISQLNINNTSKNGSDVKLQNTDFGNTKCSNVKLSIEQKSTFYMNFTEPLSSKKIDITLLNETQNIDKNIPIMIYKGNTVVSDKVHIGYYSLDSAINYQWCKGFDSFNIDNFGIDNSGIDNSNLLFVVNLSIFSESQLCKKTENQCLIMNYNYNINVIDNKTNKVYFSKKLEYKESTSYTLGGVAYNPLNYYVSLIVYKNREVIDKEVFTDELYKALKAKSN